MLGHEPIAGVPNAAVSEWRAHLVGRATVDAFRVRFEPLELMGSATLSSGMDNKLYAATTDYISRPTDRIANRLFIGTVRKAIRFQRSIVGAGDFLSYTFGLGEMELINAEQDYDYLIREYAIDGRRVTVKLGDANGPYDAFGTIFDGTATGWHVDEDSLFVDLRDFGYQLEVPAQPNTYGGEGDTDGGENIKGKRKPRAFGYCRNVTPAFLEPQKLLYQVNDGPVEEIVAVYARGVSLTKGVDHATVAQLLSADVVEGRFDTCEAVDGLFRISFANDAEKGAITCDVRGDKSGGVYVETADQIVRRLATETAEVERLQENAFTRVAAMQPAPVNLYIGPDDDIDVADACRAVMSSIGGWVGFRRNGYLEIGVLQAPEDGSPIASYDRIEIIEIIRQRLPDNIDPPPWRRRVGYARNWTLQDGDLAGSVTDERRAFLKEEYRVAEAKDDRIKTNHPQAQDPDLLEAAFDEEADALDEAQRLLVLWRRTRSLYSIRLKTQPFLLNLGDVIRITYPRWDLGAGKLLRVVSLDEDSEDNIVEVEAFG
ncbi:hypothetical protein [Pararhizobium haloflavum]|uniref:hypothetical protein n=1 Tax=Pararhizobium haloflavum TaxID=2037914 RepID=UPI000C1A6425|nr:hypothetical protein [Pararhizobium haloflavum]